MKQETRLPIIVRLPGYEEPHSGVENGEDKVSNALSQKY